MKKVRKTAKFVCIYCALITASIVTCTSPALAQSRNGNQGGGQNFGGGQGGGQNSGVSDPGVRSDAVTVGTPLSTLSAAELQFFEDGLSRFTQIDSVTGQIGGEPGIGLGPGFNSNSCGSCHAQPTVGGSSPSTSFFPFVGPNPQIAAANDAGASNSIPYFISADGPVREARFPFAVNANGFVTQTPDGGVHDVFTIAGRSDAPGCVMPQANFDQAQREGNIIFRIPTPVFGAGLIENIADGTILANMAANAQLKAQLGISGHPNLSGNDGSITRFGWKAQNKSLVIFSGEAYNVEMGVTNEAFPTERANPPTSCLYNATPEDGTNFTSSGAAIDSDVVEFSMFMRFLAPPVPSTNGIPGNPTAASIQTGQAVFNQVHCNMCHTPTMQTSGSYYTAALNNQPANLFSDLLVHHMGQALADNVSQGAAGPDEFRTAPLWGVGQRIFFLHDGRANPTNGGLLTAIEAHASRGSEANQVISLFNQLPPQEKQALLNFLRSL
ncbi:MAG: di-heme oxidoredictase family protein [Candidatus Acidiferrales bacterium]